MNKMAGNSKYLKKINRMTVLNAIIEYEPVSRQELAQLTGLTPPSITSIIRELIGMRLVEEVGLGKSAAGRKPIKLRFNPQAGLVVGIDIARNESRICLADLQHRLVYIDTLKLDLTDPDKGVVNMAEVIRQIIQRPEHQNKSILGLGVSFPGLIDVTTGMVKQAVNFGGDWSEFPLKERLQKQLGIPVFIENNSNAAVLAERWFGGNEYHDLVYINIGQGISAGIMIGDRVLQGAKGHAGEIGHMVILENGPLCKCGNRGCLEAICAIPALESRANAAGLEETDRLKQLKETKGYLAIEDVLATVGQGGYADQLLKEVGHYIGLAAANIINIYNPEAVFIGGKLVVDGGAFFAELQQTVRSHALPKIVATTDIQLSKLQGKAGMKGACALVIQKILKSPDSSLYMD